MIQYSEKNSTPITSVVEKVPLRRKPKQATLALGETTASLEKERVELLSEVMKRAGLLFLVMHR